MSRHSGRSIYPSTAKLFFPEEQTSRRDMVMTKADTGKIYVTKAKD
jgi:hypothetical protein